MLVSLLAAALAATPAPNDGACRVTWAELEPTLDGIDAAWGISEEAFRAGMATLEAGVPCLSEVLSPERAARIHRAEGLRAFLDGDVPRARAAFAAARAADPAYRFPDTMVPQGNPVRTHYDAAASTGASVRLPPPAAGTLVLDGVPGRARPVDRPALFQLDRGAVETTWLPPGAPNPAYRQRGQGFRLPLLLAGLGAAGAGAALYAVAGSLADDPPVPSSEADVQALATTNRGLVVGSAGLGVAAAGCVTTAFVWGRW